MHHCLKKVHRQENIGEMSAVHRSLFGEYRSSLERQCHEACYMFYSLLHVELRGMLHAILCGMLHAV